jgi:hypothetical protein
VVDDNGAPLDYASLDDGRAFHDHALVGAMPVASFVTVPAG